MPRPHTSPPKRRLSIRRGDDEAAFRQKDIQRARRNTGQVAYSPHRVDETSSKIRCFTRVRLGRGRSSLGAAEKKQARRNNEDKMLEHLRQRGPSV